MLIALWLLLFQLTAPSVPVLTSHDNGERWLVEYPAGADVACTVYTMQTLPGEEPYEPRHCWLLEEDSTWYEDDWAFILHYDADWDVQAHVGYVNPTGDGAIYYVSNVIRVHR